MVSRSRGRKASGNRRRILFELHDDEFHLPDRDFPVSPGLGVLPKRFVLHRGSGKLTVLTNLDIFDHQ